MEGLSKRRFFCLRESNPEVKLVIVGTDEDVSRGAAHAELVTTSVPRCHKV